MKGKIILSILTITIVFSQVFTLRGTDSNTASKIIKFKI